MISQDYSPARFARRSLLKLVGATGLTAMLPAGQAETRMTLKARIDADLSTLAGFGILRSGGAGDENCGDWIGGRLEEAGFRTGEQAFPVPWFKAETATLSAGGEICHVWPQPVVRPTGPEGLKAPVRIYSTEDDLDALDGAIAIVDLPYARHSSLLHPAISKRIRAAETAGAAAIVLVTNGPTGDPLMLNAPPEAPFASIPLCLLAPASAGPVFQAAARGQDGHLTISGESGERQARNIHGWRDGDGPAIVISTPRSGWFSCIGERGPGILCFLRLAETLPRIAGNRPVMMVATNGHEYENIGAQAFLDDHAPPPGEVGLWVHLGAGFAARDWHQAAGQMAPLDTADPQRFLLGSKALLPKLGKAFSGLSGLQSPYELDKRAAGELGTVARHGYDRVFGMLGAHRYHHSPNDDLRMTSGRLVAPVVTALETALMDLLA